MQVVITGATNGIGLAAARVFAARGDALAIVARDEGRARAVVAELQRDRPGEAAIDVFLADLSSQSDIRRVAREILERYPRIDVLANNAGAMFVRRQISVDGIEMTWAVNHLAPFLLTTLLLERLKASAPARVITTASAAHTDAAIPFDDLNADRGYRGFRRYGQSKLANILFTSELAARLEGTGVTANCFHPGLVATRFNFNNGILMRLGMSVLGLLSRRPAKGAETLVWLVTSPEVAGVSGFYFVDKRRQTPSGAAQDAGTARRLWQVSERQVAAMTS